MGYKEWIRRPKSVDLAKKSSVIAENAEFESLKYVGSFPEIMEGLDSSHAPYVEWGLAYHLALNEVSGVKNGSDRRALTEQVHGYFNFAIDVRISTDPDLLPQGKETHEAYGQQAYLLGGILFVAKRSNLQVNESLRFKVTVAPYKNMMAQLRAGTINS